MYRWSLTQSLDVTQQLKKGIRYLDCRVSWCKDTGDFHFLHGLYGGQVEPCLKEVAAFLDNHPKEVVFLDFNHFYNMQIDQHNKLARKLVDIFENKIFVFEKGVPINGISLEVLWQVNKQVIIFYQYGNFINRYGISTFWPSNMIRSPWANTSSATHLLDFLNHNYEMKRPDRIFYVWQIVLTPSTWTVIRYFYSSLKSKLVDKWMNKFDDWVKHKAIGDHGISICITDFVETSSYIPDLVALNK